MLSKTKGAVMYLRPDTYSAHLYIFRSFTKRSCSAVYNLYITAPLVFAYDPRTIKLRLVLADEPLPTIHTTKITVEEHKIKKYL